MHFLPVRGTLPDDVALTEAYKAGHAVGVLRVGSEHLFFRVGLKNYAVPYAEITRCFRRVMQVPARMCCGKGNFQVENLVICGRAEDADETADVAAAGAAAAIETLPEVELAQIQLPGAKAAKLVLEELKVKLPHAAFGAPSKTPEKVLHARHNRTVLAQGAGEGTGKHGQEGGR